MSQAACGPTVSPPLSCCRLCAAYHTAGLVSGENQIQKKIKKNGGTCLTLLGCRAVRAKTSTRIFSHVYRKWIMLMFTSLQVSERLDWNLNLSAGVTHFIYVYRKLLIAKRYRYYQFYVGHRGPYKEVCQTANSDVEGLKAIKCFHKPKCPSQAQRHQLLCTVTGATVPHTRAASHRRG